MNKLLLKYIESYLKEATIPYSGEEIDAKLQSKISPSISKDMTHLNVKETMKHLMKNIDERTCISFVNKYGEDIPSFSINPTAAYNTPHGNYAYPLTLDNIREIITFNKVKGASFAIDRPYFLLFKVTSPNALVIKKDGTTNYSEIRANKKVKNIKQDINSILRTFIYYTRTSREETESDEEWTDLPRSQLLDIQIRFQEKVLNSLDDLLKYGKEYLNKFCKDLGDVINDFIYVIKFKKDIPKNIEESYYNFLFNVLKDYLVKAASSNINKFYEGEKTDDFHKIYFIAWILSKVGQVANEKSSNGPILTLLLKAIGLEAIIDQGSETLHRSEPEQTVSLSFGNVDDSDINFIGTFNNVFADEDLNLEEIASEIYEEEGFSYEVDFFSKNKNASKISKKDKIYYDINNLMLSAQNDDLIIVENESLENGILTFKFNIYLDILDETLNETLDFLNSLSKITTKFFKNKRSSAKNKLKLYLGFSQFNFTGSGESIDVSSEIKKLYSHNIFKKFKNDFKVNDLQLRFFTSNTFLHLDQKFNNSIGNIFDKVSIYDCEEGFKLIVNDDIYLEELLNGNKIIIDNNAQITIDISKYNVKYPQDSNSSIREKLIIAGRIKRKYPQVYVKRRK